jgi:hypothetical protein
VFAHDAFAAAREDGGEEFAAMLGDGYEGQAPALAEIIAPGKARPGA